MLTGGEPLLHANLWKLCELLRDEGIAVTLVTTGLLIDKHAADIGRTCDHVVISIDGPAAVHDAIRRVPGAFEKIARGVEALVVAGGTGRAGGNATRLTARCVVQSANCRRIWSTIDAVRAIGMREISFLAADLSSTAFNRPEPWSAGRRAEIAVMPADLPAFEVAIHTAVERSGEWFDDGFVVGGVESLRRILHYYRAVSGLGPFPRVRCNAPWVSAVLEPGGVVRPCFFHDAYPTGAASDRTNLIDVLNSRQAVEFRKSLDVGSNETCQRCVCSLSLPVTAGA
jgi:MoaA/NifB/PqqE/SkfB family radical SAM enzyme